MRSQNTCNRSEAGNSLHNYEAIEYYERTSVVVSSGVLSLPSPTSVGVFAFEDDSDTPRATAKATTMATTNASTTLTLVSLHNEYGRIG